MVISMDTLVVRPHQGIGPLSLGITLDEMHRALASLPGYIEPADPAEQSVEFESEMLIEFETDAATQLVSSIEVWRPSDGPAVKLRDVDLFEGSAESVLAQLAGLGFGSTERGYVWRSSDLDVALTVEDGEIAAVLVGVPNYLHL